LYKQEAIGKETDCYNI